jgi:molecular chaperone HtpG
MEKTTVAVMNEVVSTYVCDDIAFSILSKLPLKSFKRFESARKSWSLLFENHHFMTMFGSNFLSNSSHCSCYDGESLILKECKYSEDDVFYSLAGERFEKKVKLDFSNLFEDNDDIGIFGFGSISGMLCVHDVYDHIVLWNRATQTIKSVPPSEVELAESFITDEDIDFLEIDVKPRIHGFGYDLVINDYKIIRHTNVSIMSSGKYSGDLYNIGPTWEIYSLRSDSWRKLCVDMPYMTYSILYTDGTQVYIDGVCHWL